MLVTQALDERDLLKKRIHDAIRRCRVVTTKLPNDSKVAGGMTRVHWKVPHNCFRNYEGGYSYCTGVGCECYEDLFLRKDKKYE